MKNKLKAFFTKNPTSGIKTKQLAQKLNVSQKFEYEKLKSILYQLTSEGFLIRKGKKYLLSPSATTGLTGTLSLMDGGNYGFVVLKDSSMKDIFIPARHLGTAFHGDTVEVSLLAQKRGKNIEGQIVKIISRKREELVGTLHKTKSFYFVEPDAKDIHRDIYIDKKNLGNAKDGDLVIVENIEWTNPQLNPEGEITRVIGRSGSYESEIFALATEFKLSTEFPEEVLAECEEIPVEISDEEISRRVDYRNKNVFTIDPDDAKDFDDALSIEIMEDGNYHIGIHIADVSHYVKTDSALYHEALERATSVYFVGRVIPMLPEKLSNKICSLVPNEDRLTYSVFVDITPRGRLIDYSVKKTVINSKKRFTYKEAQEVLDTGNGTFCSELNALNKLAKILRKKRIRNGSINFHSSEVEFQVDENGKPVGISPKVISESNNLIEEYMLLANQIVCKHIDKNKTEHNFPFVYRVHDLPDQEKLTEFSRFVKTLGYSVNFKSGDTAKQLQYLIEKAKDTPEEALINDIAIRSMAKAEYLAENIGHYGLAFQYYTHFTSPIRRFPDLIVHKLIFDFDEKERKTNFSERIIEYICKHSSEQERNAVQAERISVKLKQIEYLQGKLGEEYAGVISGITNFGIFIQLDDILIEGMVRLADMDDDYYTYDEKSYILKGKSKGKTYRLGDKLNVKLIRVDRERRIIDFLIVED